MLLAYVFQIFSVTLPLLNQHTMDTVFKRKIYNEMLVWKEQSAGESALLIEGPRRVGKSTITKLFAQKEYRTHIIIDFAKASIEEKNLFNDLSDMEYFFTRLKLLKGVSLYERESSYLMKSNSTRLLAKQSSIWWRMAVMIISKRGRL